MSLVSINPATGRTVARHPELPPEQALAVLAASRRASEAWAGTSFDERAACLRRVSGLLRGQADAHARLMAEEMGKPQAQGRAEIEKCAWVCDYYAEHAESFLSDQPVAVEQGRAYVAFRPLGPVLAIMPWNFPFWQVLRFAAPTLMAGNPALLKHASNVQGCAQAIETTLHEAGVPRDVFRNLAVPGRRVGELIRSTDVAAVTLTGSTPAGREVARAAADGPKKVVLELGGSDPYVVLEDADVERAAETCVASRMINTGQSCIAAKRFIVVDAVRADFTRAVVERMAGHSLGDPIERPDVDLGPLARADLRDELADQVLRSSRAGARVLLGGEPPPGTGAFYPPTVLDDVRPGMPAYDEELFGPVAAILPARDEEDAVRIANDTGFGLGAAVFTSDVARGERLAADRLAAGTCCVNDYVRSDPRLPFGGIRQSGHGRELSAFGIREFVNVKAVSIRD
ncbi:MAG: NAD-dependent succinate-semialdehyde dehydrogenase [Planctomycetota bacterium]|jgi:succinate-semialdehyde dehydrogenase/glutarate-semialdehyde dehydrogenase